VISLRELIAFTIARGDLSQSPHHEAGADRIAALAMCDPLGAALWRVLGQHDVGALREAHRLLMRALEHRVHSKLLPRFAMLVLEEWLGVGSLCPTCGGRKQATTPDGVHVDCTECFGVGRVGLSDNARIKMLRVSYKEYAQLTQVFREAHQILSSADDRVTSQLSYKLGRRVKHG